MISEDHKAALQQLTLINTNKVFLGGQNVQRGKIKDRFGFLLDNRIIIPFAFMIKNVRLLNKTFYTLKLFLDLLFSSSLFHKKKYSFNLLIR